MNTLVPLTLTLSGRACLHSLLAVALLGLAKSWLTHEGTISFFFACLCMTFYHIFKYKLCLIKYTGQLSALHTDCAGVTLAMHLLGAGMFLLRLKTIYSVMYAAATLAMLFEFMKGLGQRQYGSSSFLIQNHMEA